MIKKESTLEIIVQQTEEETLNRYFLLVRIFIEI